MIKFVYSPIARRTGIESFSDPFGKRIPASLAKIAKLIAMIRIREIIDPELKRRITEALANRRGCSSAAIPEWFELDDADYVDLLNDLKEDAENDVEDDPRM